MLRLSCSLSQRPMIAQSLEIGQRMKLAQSLSHSLEALREKITGPPGGGGMDSRSLLRTTLQRVGAEIPQESFRKGMLALVSETAFEEKMLNRCRVFAAPNEEKLAQFSVEYIFERSAQNGVFNHAKSETGGILADPPKTTKVLLLEAFWSPERIAERIKEKTELIKSVGASAGQGSFMELRELQDALTVMEHIRPLVVLMQQMFTYLLAKKVNGECLLWNFLTDVTVLERLDWILSDRLFKRFVKRFERVNERSLPETFEDAMLNVVAEYTLMSMGVISPTIFKLQKSEVSGDMLAKVEADFSESGINMRELLHRYRARYTGTLFWNRYATIGRNPTAVTDERIRRFVTVTVRADRAKVLTALSYETELFPKLVSVKEESDEEDERAHALCQTLADTFADEEFQSQFLPILRSWYPRLDIFYG